MKKIAFIILIQLLGNHSYTIAQNKIEKKLEKYISGLHLRFNTIPASRKKVLKELGNAIVKKRIKHQPINILAIGKSNAARTQVMEAFIKATTAYYDLDSIYSYSGGIEVSKVNEQVITWLREAGFSIEKIDKEKGHENPKYLISIGKKSPDYTLFSKRYDHPFNPPEDFISILVDENILKNKSLPLKYKKHQLFYREIKSVEGKVKSQTDHEGMHQIALDIAYLMDYVKKEIKLHRE